MVINVHLYHKTSYYITKHHTTNVTPILSAIGVTFVEWFFVKQTFRWIFHLCQFYIYDRYYNFICETRPNTIVVIFSRNHLKVTFAVKHNYDNGIYTHYFSTQGICFLVSFFPPELVVGFLLVASPDEPGFRNACIVQSVNHSQMLRIQVCKIQKIISKCRMRCTIFFIWS